MEECYFSGVVRYSKVREVQLTFKLQHTCVMDECPVIESTKHRPERRFAEFNDELSEC
jgi:hypothetical protein